MVFGFDPRKLIEEEKDNEKNKINEVLSEQEKFDKVVEEQNAKAKILEEQEQKKGVVAEAFEEVKDILKEVNYAKKYGNKKYAEEKRKQHPDNPIFDSPDTKVRKLVDDFSNLKDIVGKDIKAEFGGEAQAYTLATTEDTEQDEKVEVKGLTKSYSLKEREDGTIYEVENYVMDRDEVELKVKVPENFDDYKNLTVEAEFQNPDNPTLEVGIRKKVDMNLGEPVYNYEYHFLDNHYLNEFKRYLGKEWIYIADKEKGLLLFQKEKNYYSIEEFFKTPVENWVSK